MSIHPTAIVDAGVEVADGVSIGPFAVIGPGVTIGENCIIGAHSNLQGPLTLGRSNRIGLSCAIGHDPQIKGRDGPWGATRIGDNNRFREFTQVHRSMHEDGATIVGNRNYLMAYSHIAHDCVVGNDVILGNAAVLGGHVTCDDRAFLSASAAVHQFCRIGRIAMVGGLSAIHQDVPPFGMALGLRPRRLEGLNVIGMRRAGLSRETRHSLNAAYRVLFRGNLTLGERLAAVPCDTPEVEHVLEFLKQSVRGVIGFGCLSRDA